MAYEAQQEQQRRKEALARAEAVAEALRTIGNYTVRKRMDGKKLAKGQKVFPDDVLKAVQGATGLDLAKVEVRLPEIEEEGKYPVSIKLHPTVTVQVNLYVAPQKSSG